MLLLYVFGDHVNPSFKRPFDFLDQFSPVTEASEVDQM